MNPEEFQAHVENFYEQTLAKLSDPSQVAEAQYQVATSLYAAYQKILARLAEPQDVAEKVQQQNAQQNLNECIRRLKLAAKQGHEKAQSYLNSLGEPAQNNNQSTILLQPKCEQKTEAVEAKTDELPTNGDELREYANQKVRRELSSGTLLEDELLYQAGMYLYQLNRSPEYLVQAAELFTRAFNHQVKPLGHREASYMLGKMHMKGIGGLAQDRGKAIKLFSNAAFFKYKKAENAIMFIAFIQKYEAIQKGNVNNDTTPEAWLTALVLDDDADAIYEAHEMGVFLDANIGHMLVKTAVEKECVKVIPALKAAGADLDAPLGAGMAPLFNAVVTGKFRLVEALVKAGADVAIKARTRDITLLDFARTNKKRDSTIISLLEDRLLLIAEQGNATAQFMLGMEYYNKKSVARAKKWFNEAKLKGHPDAPNMLKRIDVEVDGVLAKLPILRSRAEKGDNEVQGVLDEIPSEFFSIEAKRKEQQLLNTMNKLQAQQNGGIRGASSRRSSQSSVEGENKVAAETVTEVAPKKAARKKKKEKSPQESTQAASDSQREESPKKDVQPAKIIPPKTLFYAALQARKAELNKMRDRIISGSRTQIEELQEAIVQDIKTSSDRLSQPLKEGINNAKNKERLLKLETNLRDLNALQKHIDSIKDQETVVDNALALLRGVEAGLSESEILKLPERLKSSAVFTIEEYLRWQQLLKNEDVNDETSEAFKTEWKILEENKKVLVLKRGEAFLSSMEQLKALSGIVQKRATDHSAFVAYDPNVPQPVLLPPDKVAQIVAAYGNLKLKMAELSKKVAALYVMETTDKKDKMERKTAQENLDRSQTTPGALPGVANKIQWKNPNASSKKQVPPPVSLVPQKGDISLSSNKLSKTEHTKAYVAQKKEAKKAAEVARIAARKKVEVAKAVVLRQLLERHATIATVLAHREFERRKLQEDKTTAERPNFLFTEKTMDLFNASQKLKSIVKVIKERKRFKAKEGYAILEGFAYLNDVISEQHAHPAVSAVAKSLRDKIFHQYIRVRDILRDKNLLAMVDAWIRCLETTQMPFGINAEAVLDRVLSPLLSEIYRLEEQADLKESCDAFEEMMRFGKEQHYETGCSIRLTFRKTKTNQPEIQAGHEIVIVPREDTFRVYYKHKHTCKITWFDCDEGQKALLSKLIFNDEKLDRDSSDHAKEVYKQIYAAVAAKEGCTRFGDDVVDSEAARFYWAITGAERGILEKAVKEGQPGHERERARCLLTQFGSRVFREEHLARGKKARHCKVLEKLVVEETKSIADVAETKVAADTKSACESATDFFEGLLFARPVYNYNTSPLSLSPTNTGLHLLGNLPNVQDTGTLPVIPVVPLVSSNDTGEQKTSQPVTETVLPLASEQMPEERVTKKSSLKSNAT